MRPFSMLQTLWTMGAIRCVLVKQRQPPIYSVHVFNGARAVYFQLVEHPEEAGDVAATLYGVFIDPPESS